MICKRCSDADEKSTVQRLGSTSTLMWCSPFHDEDGNYHHHDLNWVTTEHRCSNGHRWLHRFMLPCPNDDCDFPKEKPEITEIDVEQATDW